MLASPPSPPLLVARNPFRKPPMPPILWGGKIVFSHNGQSSGENHWYMGKNALSFQRHFETVALELHILVS